MLRVIRTASQSEPEDSDNEDKGGENWELRVGKRDQPPRSASAASTLVMEEAEEDGEPASEAMCTANWIRCSSTPRTRTITAD